MTNRQQVTRGRAGVTGFPCVACQGGRMRRPKLRLILGLGIPLLVVILLLVAWAVDSSSTHGKVPRNVKLAGRDISKLPEDSLAATVRDIADNYAATDVQLRTDARTYRVQAAKL